jgi:hypothetical protein
MRDARIHEQKRNDIGFGQDLKDGTLCIEPEYQRRNRVSRQIQFSGRSCTLSDNRHISALVHAIPAGSLVQFFA